MRIVLTFVSLQTTQDLCILEYLDVMDTNASPVRNCRVAVTSLLRPFCVATDLQTYAMCQENKHAECKMRTWRRCESLRLCRTYLGQI